MLSAQTFSAVLQTATELDPYGKKLSDQTITMAYLTLPEVVKQRVTDEMWVYALKQHRMDPAPDKDLSLDMQLLKHLYRCENGAPCLRWGLKADLAERMSNPDRLHGQPKSPYELGEDLGRKEPQLAPQGALRIFEEAA